MTIFPLKSLPFFVTLLVMLGLSGCASPQAAQDDNGDTYVEDVSYDPLEPMNRAFYSFNYTLDGLIIRPVTTVYRAVLPEPARNGVHNVLTNLTEPVVFLNSVLQGDPGNAFTALWRFLLNSTLGVGGLFDFAGEAADLKHRKEDFGQTMGKYGADSGPYLVLPILGPSSFRDATGLVVDFLTDPFTYLFSDEAILVRGGLTAIDARDRNYEVIDDIYKNSFDPYATIRSAYIQHRQAQIDNNNGAGKGRAPFRD